MSGRTTNRVEVLLANYRKRVALPWPTNLAGSQRVWFALYPPDQERRLRFRLDDFQMETREAGHTWVQFDLTDTFSAWMSTHDYHEAYFDDLGNFTNSVRMEFQEHLIDLIRSAIADHQVSDNTVFALIGVGTLFGLIPIAEVIKQAARLVPGRLLVFFPGQKTENNTYKLLDAAVAWNYLAEAIPCDQGVSA